MKNRRIYLVPCRPDMPEAGLVENRLCSQFSGMVVVVPPPTIPKPLSEVIGPLESGDSLPAGPVIVLLDSQCFRSRPGFIRTLLSDPQAEAALLVASDHQCERLFHELFPGTKRNLVCLHEGDGRIARYLLARLEITQLSKGLRGLRAECGLSTLVGQSPFITELRQILPVIAHSDAAVLISGETGTGKEVVAHAVHYLSPRRYRAFVPLHCGAVPSGLFENELFGHRPGAYTGAQTQQQGILAEAHGGTLFLDEISTLPVTDQAKLLRFLQEGEYRPLSGRQTRADVRVIAASNIDLSAAVEQMAFRSDLLYRINTIPIEVPPLRDRPADILPLANHFLKFYANKGGSKVRGLSSHAVWQLLSYNWPGNVRELQHLIERAILLAVGPEISEIQLPNSRSAAHKGLDSLRAEKRILMEHFERAYVTMRLQESGGNITEAARLANVDRRSFVALLRKHRIDTARIYAEQEANSGRKSTRASVEYPEIRID